jgi:hypothetical protein
VHVEAGLEHQHDGAVVGRLIPGLCLDSALHRFHLLRGAVVGVSCGFNLRHRDVVLDAQLLHHGHRRLGFGLRGATAGVGAGEDLLDLFEDFVFHSSVCVCWRGQLYFPW